MKLHYTLTKPKDQKILITTTLLISLILHIYSPDRVWLILIIMLGGGLIITYLWTRSLRKELSLIREVRFGWAQVGDLLEERFTIENASWFPALWLEVHDQSTLPGSSILQVRSIGAQSTTQWKRELLCTRRGVFTLGPTQIRTGDPLGLFQIKLDFPQKTALFVSPPIVPLPPIQIAPGGRAGEGRRFKREAFERTITASYVREYSPHDGLKAIHWPISAHKDDLYVRVFDSTPASDWWIFLDLNSKIHIGVDQDSTLEHGIILAASLADQGLREKRSVGFIAQAQNLIWLPPAQGPIQRMRILRSLAVAEAGDLSFDILLSRGLRQTTRGASLILITPDLSADWLQSLLPLIAVGNAPTVLYFNLETFGGLTGNLKFESLLRQFGIAHYAFDKETLDRPEARPGIQGQMKWLFTPTGKAVLAERPANIDWRRVG